MTRPKRTHTDTQTAKTLKEETFGERLARLRKGRGLTQTELAELLGASQRIVTYYERESGRPPARLLPQLADALGVTVDQLVGYEKLREPPPPKHSRLWRKLREVEKLSEDDRKTIIKLVDALLARRKLGQHRS